MSEKVKLTEPQSRVLRLLRDGRERTFRSAGECGMPYNVFSGVARRLYKAGLLSMGFDNNLPYWCITPAGREALKEADNG